MIKESHWLRETLRPTRWVRLISLDTPQRSPRLVARPAAPGACD